MNFDLGPDLQALQHRTREFIAQKIMPFENDPRCTPHGPTEELRHELIALARDAGLLSSHMPTRLGGLKACEQVAIGATDVTDLGIAAARQNRPRTRFVRMGL